MRPTIRPATLALVLVGVAACSEPGTDSGDWPHYARDLGASKYSPLDQIDAELRAL